MLQPPILDGHAHGDSRALAWGALHRIIRAQYVGSVSHSTEAHMSRWHAGFHEALAVVANLHHKLSLVAVALNTDAHYSFVGAGMFDHVVQSLLSDFVQPFF